MSQPFFPAGFRATDGDDNPLAGGSYEFYAAGTSTPKGVYSIGDVAEQDGDTLLGSIIELNASGMPTSDGNTPVLVFPAVGDYKVILKNADGVTITTLDNWPGAEEPAEEVISSLPETPVVSKTTTYSVVEADQGKLFNLNPTGGAFAVTLPSAVSVGDNFRVGFRHNGTANTATILTTLSQTIRRHKNSQAWTLKSQGECFWLVSDGSDWTVDSYTPPLIDAHNPFITIVDRLAAPPTNPTGGARYLINDTPTGVWLTLGFANKDIAEADGNGSWIKYTPVNGWLAYVQDEQLLTQYRGSAWTDLTNITAPTATTLKAAVFEDQKSNGTVGGTATTGAWTARTINTQVSNTITGVSLATDQITLPVGTYAVNFAATYRQTGQTLTRIKAISGTVDVEELRSLPASYPGADSGSDNLIIDHWQGGFGILTVTATAVIELQYYAQASLGGTSSLGVPSTEPDTDVETYSRVTILDLAAIQGPQGGAGAQGDDGLDAGYYFQWSTSISGDPGTGKIRGNHASLASVTAIAVHKTDAAGADLDDVIASWDDSTSTTSKARVRLQKEGATQNFAEFRIAGGSGTDAGTYWTFPVEYVSHGGTLGNGDDLAVAVYEKGDIGDPGTTVPNFSGLSALTGADRVAADLIGVYDASTASLKSMTVTEFFNALPVTIVSAAAAVLVGTAVNAGIDLGSTTSSNTPFIDGHSSGNNIGYDARLIWSGGDATNGGGNISLLGTFVIEPRASSLKKGLQITQSASGSTGGSYGLNFIDITADDSDGGASAAKIDGLLIEHTFGGSAMRGGRHGIQVFALFNATSHASNPDRNYVGGAFSCIASDDDGGGSGTEKGAVFGLNANAVANSGATFLLNLSGAEINVAAKTGSSVKYKSGMQVVGRSDDAVRGSTYDALLALSNQIGAVTWTDGILVGDMNGIFPILTTGTVMRAMTGTVANGIDLNALTISSFAFRSPGFSVNGAGLIASSVAGLPAQFINSNDNASSQALRIEGDRATPAANDAVYASMYLSSSTGVQREVVRLTAIGLVVTNGSETSRLDFSLLSGGAQVTPLTLATTTLRPATNDVCGLGDSTRGFSDLFLAAGGEIRLNNVQLLDTVGGFSTQTATAANIAAVGNAINTANKRAGKMVYDTTNNRIMVASGSAAADPWYVADASASVTPA